MHIYTHIIVQSTGDYISFTHTHTYIYYKNVTVMLLLYFVLLLHCKGVNGFCRDHRRYTCTVIRYCPARLLLYSYIVYIYIYIREFPGLYYERVIVSAMRLSHRPRARVPLERGFLNVVSIFVADNNIIRKSWTGVEMRFGHGVKKIWN